MEAVLYSLLGLIVLFAPGFLLTLALYPKREQLDFWQRVAASVGLSVLVLIYVGFVLAQPGLRMLRSGPFLGAVFAVCVFFALLAYLRGGFEVLATYWRVVVPVLQRLKPPPRPKVQPPEEKPPQAEAPPGVKPFEEEIPKEAPEEKAREEARPELAEERHEGSTGV